MATRWSSLPLVLGALSVLGAAPAFARPATPPAWPSLKQQVAEAQATPGSALERLIRSNRDLRRLDPREAADTLGLPPWLRLFWRKSYPGWRYDAGDPTHGYPLVLRDFYEWASRHPDLRPAPEPALSALGPAANEAALPEGSSIGGDVLISNPTRASAGSAIAIDPRNPLGVVVAANDLTLGLQALYFSSDGGATWGQRNLQRVNYENDLLHSDPTVNWDPSGNALSSTVGIGLILDPDGNPTALRLRLRFYGSGDGGFTWYFVATISGAQQATEKQKTWIDNSDTSPHKGSVYACWHDGRPAFVNRLPPRIENPYDGRWKRPIQVSGDESAGTSIGCDIKTNSAGEVFVLWPATGSRTIAFSKSTNGGVTWSRARVLGHTLGAFNIGIPAMARRRALLYVTSGAYKTDGRDLAYAAWTDLSGDAGCRRPADEPGSNVDSACKTRIWLARSTDGGATWSAPRKIHDGATRNDQFNPWLAVDEATGTLGIIYYDTIGDPGRRKTDVYFQGSTDDGVTWSEPERLTTAPSDETIRGQSASVQYGDYNGLSGFMGRFLPIWTDHREGVVKEQLRTAPVDHE